MGVCRVELGSIYTKCQRRSCNDASDTVLIEKCGVTRKWVTTPIWSNSTVLNENSTASIIPELSLGANGHLRLVHTESAQDPLPVEFLCRVLSLSG